jgi:hypothetical protein
MSPSRQHGSLQTVAVTMRPFGSWGGLGLTALEQAAVGSRVLEPKDRSSEGFKPSWTPSYARRLAITDAAAIVGSVGIAQPVRFGADPATFHSESVVYGYTAVYSPDRNRNRGSTPRGTRASIPPDVDSPARRGHLTT